MAAIRKKTDDVLASARKQLRAQLSVVRDEAARLATEERALTDALASLNGDSPSTAPASGAGTSTSNSKRAGRRRSTGRAGTGRRHRRRGTAKPTADRVKELQGLLSDGPKSRKDLAAALKVSPARVQQLLAELGSSVSSQAAPGRNGKLWSLKAGTGNGASAARATAKPTSKTPNPIAPRKPAAAKAAATK